MPLGQALANLKGLFKAGARGVLLPEITEGGTKAAPARAWSAASKPASSRPRRHRQVARPTPGSGASTGPILAIHGT